MVHDIITSGIASLLITVGVMQIVVARELAAERRRLLSTIYIVVGWLCFWSAIIGAAQLGR